VFNRSISIPFPQTGNQPKLQPSIETLEGYSLVVFSHNRIIVARSPSLCWYPLPAFPDYLLSPFQHLHIFRIILLKFYTEFSSDITDFVLDESLREEGESVLVFAIYEV
jgi:hypothetical protein